MPRRPRSITIISWLFIVFGAIALLSGVVRGGDLTSHWYVHLSRILQIVAGIFMLYGQQLGPLAPRRLDRLPHHHQRPSFATVPVDARRNFFRHSLLHLPPPSIRLLPWSLVLTPKTSISAVVNEF